VEVRFADPDLDRLETDPAFDAGLPRAVVKGYRKVMGWVWSALDERDFYNYKSLHYEKLEGRRGQHSMRVNDQFRLIVEYEDSGQSKRIVIVAIENHYR
jgi:proteic killer suppression protein